MSDRCPCCKRSAKVGEAKAQQGSQKAGRAEKSSDQLYDGKEDVCITSESEFLAFCLFSRLTSSEHHLLGDLLLRPAFCDGLYRCSSATVPIHNYTGQI